MATFLNHARIPSALHPDVAKFIALTTRVRRRGRGDYLALGDEAGLGSVPSGLPARGVAEGKDGVLAVGDAGGRDGRAEERERRVKTYHGGRRGVVLRVAGGPIGCRSGHWVGITAGDGSGGVVAVRV
jgi:hypothetical protein